MATIDRTTIAKPSPIVEDDQGQLRARQGISREVVSELSKVKGEPDWMAQKRLKSLEIFERKPVPTWGPDLSGLNLDDLVLYSPPTAGRFNSWDDVPAEMKQTYEDLGIPQAEREHLAGVVGVWRQEPVYEGLKEEYAKQGILFCSMDTAITEYPELVQKYFMTKCVPAQDNKFSALHGAVWSGGAFCYIPKGVKCDLPLQSYFRMEGAGEGTFEHTLIVADEGAEVNYIEGCTAQTYSVNSMHSAVVEIFVHEGAKARYTTVQNWTKDVYNLNTKRAVVDAEGTVEWVGRLDGRQVRDALPRLLPDGRGRARRPPQRRRGRQGRAQGHRRQGRPPRAQHDVEHPRQVDLQGRRDHGLPRVGQDGPQLSAARKRVCSATA